MGELKLKLDNYLAKCEDQKGKFPVCEEERQYALFLYTLLLRDDKSNEKFQKIKKEKLGIDGDIKEVYYEAALMRDFRKSISDEGEENKVEFNRNLLRFCFKADDCDPEDERGACEKILKKINTEENTKELFSYHLGAKKGGEAIKEFCSKIGVNDEDEKPNVSHSIQRRFLIARYMMNAEPDIVVIYEKKSENGSEYHAKALECKYTQPEGKYYDLRHSSKTIPQTFIQEAIMKFLFKEERVIPEQKDKAHEETINIRNEYKKCIDAMSLDKGHSLLQYGGKDIINDGVQIVKFEKCEDSDQCNSKGEISVNILLDEYERLKNVSNH